jgi:periplasmic divalent cation tolerance protein
VKGEAGPVLALSTAATVEDAERIGRALVDGGAAACVNVVPGVVSIYRWKGEVHRDAEALLVIKTRGERLGDLEAALLRAHSYEVPELIALRIADGHEPYLAWLEENVRSQAVSPRSRPAPARGRPPGPRRLRSRR